MLGNHLKAVLDGDVHGFYHRLMNSGSDLLSVFCRLPLAQRYSDERHAGIIPRVLLVIAVSTVQLQGGMATKRCIETRRRHPETINAATTSDRLASYAATLSRIANRSKDISGESLALVLARVAKVQGSLGPEGLRGGKMGNTKLMTVEIRTLRTRWNISSGTKGRHWH
jgi:hypothetical protein